MSEFFVQIPEEEVISALRGRKTISEIQRIKWAIASTLDIYTLTFSKITPGMTEIEVAEIMQAEVEEHGLGYE